MNIGLGIGIPFAKTQIWLSLFDPSKLFANGEQGVWYDPSDLTTLYQDAAGTTQVTAVERPVGLMLDKSKGLVLGPELVTNGDFSNGMTGWTPSGCTQQVVENELEITTTVPGFISSDTTITTVIGKTYKYTANIRRNQASGLARITVVGIIDGSPIISLTPTSVSIVFRAVSTTTTIRVGAYNTTINDKFSYSVASVRELPGNHAFQTTSTKRPVLSARVNLLTKTEDISDAAWLKSNTTPATAQSLLETTTTGTHACTQIVTTVAASYIYSVKLKANGRTRFALAGTSSLGGNLGSGIFFDLSTGSYVSGATGTPSIKALTDGWYQISYAWTTPLPAASGVIGIYLADSGTNLSYPGDVTKGMFVRDFDLRVTNTGVNLPAYQRVNTATDYDTQGFPTYLKFDGIDDALQTNSIDFTATDKMTVFAGVRKLSDAAPSILTELSANANPNNGAFFVTAPENTSPAGNYASLSRGTAGVSASQSAKSTVILAPNTSVLTATHDISGDLSALRINGAANGTNGTGDKGTGNFGNYPLYIGARACDSLFFNGNLYNLIVRGAQSTAAQIESTEQWVNGKTAAF